jgi:hypothetical protein
MSLPNEPSLAAPVQAQIDAICLAMENAWLAGETPRISSFAIRGQAAWREALLQELMRLDIEHRRRRGIPLGLAVYKEQLPGQAELVEQLCGPAHDAGGNRALVTSLLW